MVLDEDSLQYSKNFLHFLTKYKETPDVSSAVPIFLGEKLVTIAIQKNFNKDIAVRSCEYYNLRSFKTLICELVFRAINMFPVISEYVIECTNNEDVSKLSIGYYSELDNDNEPTVMKLENKHFNFCLTKDDVQAIYIANRSKLYDVVTVNMIINCLYFKGYEPTVKTSYTVVKSYTKK